MRLILVYAAGNIGVVRFYRSERRDEFNPFLHLVLPMLRPSPLPVTRPIIACRLPPSSA